MAEKQQDFNISDESVDILAGKIQHLEFVDLKYELKAYNCCQCKNVAIRHRIANCQDVLCHECYALYYQRPCPACQTVIKESIHDDDFMKTILSLKVACEFKKNGCQIVISLGEFLDHVRDCKLATNRLLPKVYKSDSRSTSFEQINDYFEDMKGVMRDLQTENQKLNAAMLEMKEENAKQLTTEIASLVGQMLEENKKQMATVTTEILSHLGHMKKKNENQFELQNVGLKRQEKEIYEMKKAIDGLHTNLKETSVATNELSEHVTSTTKQLITKLEDIQTGNENQFTQINTFANKHGQEILDLKNVIDGVAVEIPQVKEKLDTYTTNDCLSMGSNQPLSQTIKNQLSYLQVLAESHEQTLKAIRYAIDDLTAEIPLVHDKLDICATTEHLTMKSNELLSRLDQIGMQSDENKNQLKYLQAGTLSHEETLNTISNAIDDLNAQIPLVREELQNQHETDFEHLTTVIVELQSQFDRTEIQDENEIQLEYKKSQESTSESSESLHSSSEELSGEPGETIPRALNEEVHSGDSQETTFNWTISGISEKIRKRKCPKDIFAESEEFSIPSHRLKFRAELWRDSEFRMYIFLNFTKKPLAGSTPFLHSRKFVLLDQSNDGEKQDVVLLDQPRFGQNNGNAMTRICFWNEYFFPIPLLQDSDVYVKNDTILIRIIFEPIVLMFKRVSSMDGTLLMRIDNYRKRKREEIEGIREFLTSESFYTSDNGYRMDVAIYLNGYGPNEGRGITICLMFRIGEWDDSISFPIKCKYTCVLMDQSGALIKRDISNKSGVQQYKKYHLDKIRTFLSHKVVEELPYLKDDSLLIKLHVEIVKP